MRILSSRRAPLAGAIVGLALIVGACAGTATPPPVAGQPSPASTAAPTAPAQSIAPPTGPATGSAAPTVPPLSSFVPPSFTGNKDLEATLPDTYLGVTLAKASFTGTDLLATQSQSNQDFLALIQSLGKQPSDLSFAVASDPEDGLGVVFGAYQIKGADSATWAPQLYALAAKGIEGSTSTDLSLGGQTVKKIVDPSTPQITYAWPKGDTLFIVVTTTDDLAGPAIAAVH